MLALLTARDIGNIVMFLLAIGLGEIGKKLDKGYKCPLYCEVAHTHIYWEKYETEKGNLQTAPRIHRAVRDTSEEQSAGSIRRIASID